MTFLKLFKSVPFIVNHSLLAKYLDIRMALRLRQNLLISSFTVELAKFGGSSEMYFFVKLGLWVTPLIYATLHPSGNLLWKRSSDWLSAGSNVVASESMIFVFEFISKPFASSPERNFFSDFFHCLSCVDCKLCRLVLCFCVWPCFNRVVDPLWHQLLHLERLWRAAKISFVFPTFRFCSLDVANKHGRYNMAFAHLRVV